MRWKDLDAATVWRLHVASGLRLGAAVVRALDRGLEPHLVATTSTDGTRSVTVLGRDPGDGTTRTYQEVELVDDEDAGQAWENLRLDDVLNSARATVAKADACLDAAKQGKPLPIPRPPRGAS